MLAFVQYYLPVCLAALVAGGMNALAGGGTLLTFPALFALFSLDPTYAASAGVFANATSTTALAPASFSSAWGYRAEVKRVQSWLYLLWLPSLLGGVCGAVLVSLLDPKLFDKLVPWLILLASVLFTLQPLVSRLQSGARSPADPNLPATTPLYSAWGLTVMVLFQFLIGLYGGYFGAGIGILMLSSLALMQVGNLHEMNALKTILAGGINAVSIVIFVWHKMVVWDLALAMTIASVMGGYFAARYGRKLPQIYVRVAVIVIGFAMSGVYFWKQWNA